MDDNKPNPKTLQEFNSKCFQNEKKIFIDFKEIEKDYISRYNFITKNSADIPYELIKEAESLNSELDRKNGFMEINKYINNEVISRDIELGLFEFTLLHITTKKIDYAFLPMVYNHKLYTICHNLDPNNTNINNKTLLDAINMYELDSRIVAFLSPQQIHPEKWKSIMQKRFREYDAIYNIETNDMYECKKCGERKSIIEHVQLRSADEGSNMLVTCVVCGSTVTY